MSALTGFRVLAFTVFVFAYAFGDIVPPDAMRVPAELVMHGDTRTDNYYWLKDRDNPDVIAYLEAENTYAGEMLAHTEALQEELYSEMFSRIPQDDISVPYLRNGYYYYSIFEQGCDYPVYARKQDRPGAPEEIMLDVNILAQNFSYFDLASFAVSPDNRVLAFSVDTAGNHRCTVFFKDLITGEMLADRIENASGRTAWANDSRTYFFGRPDITNRPERIMRGYLGSEDEELVFLEEDPEFWPWVYRSKSGEYICICSSSDESSETLVLDADNPRGELFVIQPRTDDLIYWISHAGDFFFILTDLDAQNYRLMKTPVTSPSVENWVEVIPHREDVLLENFEIFNRFLVLSERKNGLTQLRVMSLETGDDHYIEFNDEAWMAYTGKNYEFDTNLLRFGYTSMTTPWSTYDYNMDTRESVLLKRQEIPGGYDPVDYRDERIYAEAEDGTLIPISIVYRADLFDRGNNPLLLYGYGAYGRSLDPVFRFSMLSLLDRGFVYAIAHVRGGQEMGRWWYDEGRLLNKMNTFTDFIDSAEYLAAEGYCDPNMIFAMGESAGGLLMGAVVNMRPDLWRGVLAGVPFVDVITTMLDETIPLTTSEYEEWGNPNDPVFYEYMLAYSPVDNVREVDYPAMFVFTGLNDSQVGFWEPAKWVAKLRDMKTDDNPLVFLTEMESGHGGVSGRFNWLHQIAVKYAFILDQAGIAAENPPQ